MIFDKIENRVKRTAAKVTKKIVNKKSGVLTLLLLSMVGLMTGCMPNRYTEKQLEEAEAKGKAMLEAYLEEHYPGIECNYQGVDSGNCIESEHEIGNYLTNVYHGSITVDGESVFIYINMETGDVYTSRYRDEILNEAEGSLVQLLAEYGIDCQVAVIDTRYSHSVISHNVPTDKNGTVDTTTYFQAIFPDNITNDNAEEFWKEDFTNPDSAVGFTAFICTNQKVIDSETWFSLREKYPAITDLTLINVNEDDFKEWNETQELPSGYRMDEIAEYGMNRELYSYWTFEKVENDFIGVNSPNYCLTARREEIEKENGEIEVFYTYPVENEYETTIDLNDPSLIIHSFEGLTSYLYLIESSPNFYKNLLFKEMRNGEKRNEYNLRALGNGYYTLNGKSKDVYPFRGNIEFSIE